MQVNEDKLKAFVSIIIDELVELCAADQGVINLVSRDRGSDLVTVVRHDQETQESIIHLEQ